MVRGLDLFTDYFKDFQDSYILIGGAAIDIWMNEVGLPFRPTRDLDIILIIEALNEPFVKHFWKFIEEGKYQTNEKSNGEPKVYRFIKPGNDDYPYQIELFSLKPDILGDFADAHLTPIPLGEEIGSLSAILMNDDYYAFSRENSDIVNGLHLANTTSLICLKAKAFLDIKERLDNEDWVDNNEKSKLKKDYKKHRNDVIRIVLILTEDDKIQLKNPIKKDMHKFMEAAQADPPDYKQLAINFKVNTINSDELFEQLISNFNLNRSE